MFSRSHLTTNKPNFKDLWYSILDLLNIFDGTLRNGEREEEGREDNGNPTANLDISGGRSEGQRICLPKIVILRRLIMNEPS